MSFRRWFQKTPDRDFPLHYFDQMPREWMPKIALSCNYLSPKKNLADFSL